MKTFRGAITALITPFRGGAIDFDALEQHVERQITAGIDGLVPCGTTGESPTLSHDEQDEVIRRVVRVARGRTPIIAGAGSNSTAATVQLARHAASAGADGLLLVNPYYNRPTQAGLFEHFSTIARSIHLPIMLYNIPGRTGVELSVATIVRLFEAHDNITMIKHATGRVDDAAELLQACRIAVLSGDDPITWPLMALGAVGVVSVMSNLAPRAVKRLTDAALAGDFAAAQSAHRALYPLSRALLSLETNPIPIKTALAMRGWCAEEFRLPMCPLAPENRRRLDALLSESMPE
jgi:4-hydroxy-tetrahydrodipicolinate synthase